MAKMYWSWTRDCGPGLCSVEVPLTVCERELELASAQPLYPKQELSVDALDADGVVLEVYSLESQGRLPAGFYRLVEHRNDPVVQKLLRSF